MSFARRISTRFQWLGGAVLTKNDLAYLDPITVGEFRSRGLEFWTIRTHDELQSMSLLVRLPPWFAPKPGDVAVYYKPPGPSDDVPSPIEELNASVRHHALGLFSLEIPYPRPQYYYSLAWPVADDPSPSAAAVRFRETASAKGDQLLNAYAGVFGHSSIADAAILGLYVPVAGNSAILTKTGEFRRGVPGGEAPGSLSLRANELIRHAFWGKVQFALSDAHDPGFAPGERAVIIVPIRQFGRENEATWGLIRIGIHADSKSTDAEVIKVLFKEMDVFTDGVPMLLQKAA
jgi:hypothetical protein